MLGVMLGEAWHVMASNRTRSFLTMLGMMIGVGAVILMLAIGEGVQSSINASISTMGSNLFIIVSGSTTSGGVRMGGGASPTLTLGDAQAVSELPDINAAAPFVTNSAQVIYGANNWSTSIMGVTPDYMGVANWKLQEGSMIVDADVRSASRLAVLGKTAADNLFGDENPLGKTIRIKQVPFYVIGLLSPKGQALDGRDQDDAILVPVTTAQRKLFGSQFQNSVRMILVQASSPEAMPLVEPDMGALLRQRHHLREGADDDFTIRNMTAIANTAAETAKLMSLLLGAIASISLVVGGVGIMNIMLVSVTERTREIGIRMAIGARQRDILMQFLLEAISISVVGSMIGVAIGVGLSYVANSRFDVPVIITTGSILLGFGVAAVIGIFFGYYPALKASRLRPIEALRYQ